MRQLTLGWLTLIKATPPDVISAAHAAGFKSVSIRITGRKPGDGFPQSVGNEPAMRDLKKRLADGGLRLSNTSSYHLTPDITLDMLRPVIDASVELGAAIMVATCSDPDHKRWADFASRYCEEARKAGLKVALEFVPFSEAKTIEQGNALVQAVGAPISDC